MQNGQNDHKAAADDEAAGRNNAGAETANEAADGPAREPSAAEFPAGDSDRAEGAEAAPAEGDPVAVLQAEVSELKDQLLRALAETENLRRRAQREREDLQRYAAAPLARDLLAVADNLRRALESVDQDKVPGDEGLKTLVEGVQLTERELLAAFEKHHIAKLDPVGEKLDPHRHEAMFEMPAPGHANGTVAQVVQSGYLMHDRLLRPARVGVARNPAGSPKQEQEASEPGGQVDTSA